MADPETHGLKTSPRKTRRVLRLIGWNLLLTLAGLVLIALTGEVYLRLKRSMMPFSTIRYHLHFVPKVGLMLKPNAEMRWTNSGELWTISRTNSLGFLDREPIRSERAAASCHITMIGDSFVEAREVPIADKFHVRLEELATQELPHLDITTSAFGKRATGQINQLPYYDEFVRHLSPKLVVLVFVDNDFRNNSPILTALELGTHPDWQPWVTATRDENGTMKLRPPHPDWQTFRLPRLHKFLYVRILEYLSPSSYFAQRLHKNISPSLHDSQLIAWVKLLSEHPAYESLFNRWQPKTRDDIIRRIYKNLLLPAFEQELAFTAFALDQFKERTERDGGSLVILASHTMGTLGHGLFDHMSALAEARSIPVIDQYDYIRRQAGEIQEAYWAPDPHWNTQGHQWAAEALLEYLKENPQVCTRPADTGTP